jgi:hypothetical protein
MTRGLFRMFRLAGPNDDDVFPSLNQIGAFIAKNVPLLEPNEIGQWQPRPQECLEAILSAGYRFPVDLSRRMQTLETVAQALNDNNPCLAAIALVHAQFPPLPDNAAGRRMAEAEELAKGSLA